MKLLIRDRRFAFNNIQDVLGLCVLNPIAENISHWRFYSAPIVRVVLYSGWYIRK